jgi:hypothetical protein
MTTLNNGFVPLSNKGKPMLEQTHWEKISSKCHTLVDEDYKVVSVISTPYSEDDGDVNFIWEVEIDGEEFGAYVSLYCAKIAVQKAIADWDAKMIAASEKKKSKVKKNKEVKKKSVARK